MRDTLEPGTLIGGKYRIDAYIGSGGMGKVYEAFHVELSRKVAIKILKYFEADDETSISRFHREARAAGIIGHDNICEVTDFGMDEAGVAYLVMPLLQGSSFSKMLTSEAPLLGRRIVDISCQALKALEAAHRRNIIHRDLKPGNLFVTRVGDRADFVKLLDFGISKYLDSDASTKLTRTGLVPGTPLYMAPEQAEGGKNLDHRADIYSVGVLLFEAFTGTLPFTGDSYNEIVINIVTKPFKYPRSVDPRIPVAVEKIILKAMSRDPSLRFKDAKEMREALEALDSATLDECFGKVESLSAEGAGIRTVSEASPSSKLSGKEAVTALQKRNRLSAKSVFLYAIVVLALVNFAVILLGMIGYFLGIPVFKALFN
jgi:serine/threonine-protein kinase